MSFFMDGFNVNTVTYKPFTEGYSVLSTIVKDAFCGKASTDSDACITMSIKIDYNARHTPYPGPSILGRVLCRL